MMVKKIHGGKAEYKSNKYISKIPTSKPMKDIQAKVDLLEKRITPFELVTMTKNEYKMFNRCMKPKAFRIMGMNWKKYIEYYIDPLTQDLVFRYI